MQKILISACLLGAKVRYDGGHCLQDHPLIQRWLKEERVVPFCPEMAGGLAIPRPAAEIIDSRVVTNTGVDVSAEYHRGAQLALALCQKYHIKFALLKARSPSCGNLTIYDGSFSQTLREGQGITAALLTANQIEVFNETQIELLAETLLSYEIL